MATVAKILDRTRFESRARIIDVIALGVLMVVGAVIIFDMYTFGWSSAQIAAGATGADLVTHDQLAVRMVAESFMAAAAFCWIAYRLMSGSARRAGG